MRMDPLALFISGGRQPRLRLVILVCACLVVPLFPSRTRGAVIPAGTAIEVRLSTPAGSRISKRGDRIKAAIIAPVLAEDGQVLLEGAIGFRFDSMTLSEGREVPILTRVREVENARERVDEAGNIDGILPTANLSSGISFAISTVLLHTELAVPAAIVKVIA